jgi:hypothetical protein
MEGELVGGASAGCDEMPRLIVSAGECCLRVWVGARALRARGQPEPLRRHVREISDLSDPLPRERQPTPMRPSCS